MADNLKTAIPHRACRTPGECRREQVCLDGWQCASDQTTPARDIVERLRETLTGEDTDEAMWQRIVSERREAADAILALRVKLHRERSKRGHAIAARHYSGPESDRQNGQ